MAAIAAKVRRVGRCECPWELLRVTYFKGMRQENAARALAEAAGRHGMGIWFDLHRMSAGGRDVDAICVLFSAG